MSVIWSGVTEEGAVVPVQVTAEGKVVAVGDGPEGDYLKLTGGNLTGDLTVNERITLSTDGSAEFAGAVNVGIKDTSAGGVQLREVGSISSRRDGALTGVYTVYNGGNGASDQVILFSNDGSATFAGDVEIGANTIATGPSLKAFGSLGVLQIRTDVGNYDSIQIYNGGNAESNKTVSIGGDGRATFSGDVVIGSRGEQWLIRESNGVAMLVKQSLRQPREEKLRDLPNELDLIEAALNEIMEKLRMTPPTGWPVWDGQSEVTSDNENA